MLYQIGTFELGGPEAFYVDLVRQFEVLDDEGQHDHYEQVHCELRFDSTEDTRAFGQFERWWFRGDPGATWSEFVAAVERRPEFKGLSDAMPRDVAVWQEEV